MKIVLNSIITISFLLMMLIPFPANAFSSIPYDGYNSVRVMINSEGIGTADSTTLSLYSNIKFIDMHLYPNGSGYTIDSDMLSSEYNYINKARTPLILGEFGGVTTLYPNIESAAHD